MAFQEGRSNDQSHGERSVVEGDNDATTAPTPTPNTSTSSCMEGEDPNRALLDGELVTDALDDEHGSLFHHPQHHRHQNQNHNHYFHFSFSQALWSKLTWLEVSGSCGDFGTLWPLLVALARERQIYLASTLFWTGGVHLLLGGWYFSEIPIPLQPMHMISVQALSHTLESKAQVATAGFGMGVFFLALQQFGGIRLLHHVIPRSVIGGLQWGVGWKLVLKAIQMIQRLPVWWWSSDHDSIEENDDTTMTTSLDCIATAVLVSALTLYALRPRRIAVTTTTSSTTRMPSFSFCPRFLRCHNEVDDTDEDPPAVGLYLLGVGLVLAGLTLVERHSSADYVSPPLHREPLVVAIWSTARWPEDYTQGWVRGTLPQLPLTTLNSCLSVCALAHALFPTTPTGTPGQQLGPQPRRSQGQDHGQSQGHQISHASLSRSIGWMNTLLCPLGMMPHCHGAGGLAGQYRLGATSGVSMMVLGIFKLALSGVAAQGSLLVVLDALPTSILGVLLALSGHELASTGLQSILSSPNTMSTSTSTTSSRGGEEEEEDGPTRRLQQDQRLQQDLFIALTTAVVIVGTGMAHVGALCGWLVYLIYGTGIHDLFGSRNGSTNSSGERGDVRTVRSNSNHNNHNHNHDHNHNHSQEDYMDDNGEDDNGGDDMREHEPPHDGGGGAYSPVCSRGLET